MFEIRLFQFHDPISKGKEPGQLSLAYANPHRRYRRPATNPFGRRRRHSTGAAAAPMLLLHLLLFRKKQQLHEVFFFRNLLPVDGP